MNYTIKLFCFSFLLLLSRYCFANNILITEFMAKNVSSFTNETGNTYDWIEIYNPETNDVNLNGWFLSDDSTNFTKWSFPATNFPAKSYLLIFASDKNISIAGKELHTNFKLSSGGEFLAIIKPDSNTVSFAYSPNFPQQIADVSCGLPAAATYEKVLITSTVPCKAYVPVNDSLSLMWTENNFDDSSWISGSTGVGYDNNPDYLPLINLNLHDEMYNKNASCYIRIPFFIENTSELSSLTLRMKYDDGFVAYINGEETVSANAPGSLTWNSQATAIHDDSQSTIFVDYNIPFNGGIKESGTNILAIHGLNLPSTSSDALYLPELHARFSTGYFTNQIAYFFSPTPGLPNNSGIPNIPPIISFMGHFPLVPEDNETIIITAKITKTTFPVGDVALHYRVMFGTETTIKMTNSYGEIYSGSIPASAYGPGEMVRYYITASDTNNNSLRWPLFSDATEPEYLGTVINDPSISTNVSVYHWFVEDSASADTRGGSRCSFFYNDEFYDNIFCRLRGGSSSYQTKKPHKFEFNSDHEFKFSKKYKRADEINVLAMYNDTSYMRDFLSWEILKMSDLPYCYAENVQIRQNGSFYGLEVFVEQVDGHFLRRNKIDDNGSLYKSPHPGTRIELSTIGNLEKKRPKDGDFTDMTNFINGIHLPTDEQIKTYMFDNVNIPEVVNYIAANRIFMDFDFTFKNYYLYHNIGKSDEWEIYAWDKDLTFGMIWGGTNVFGDELHAPAGYGVATMYWGNANYLYNRIIYLFRDMYARRIRTLMDEILQSPETPRENLKLEKRVYELHDILKPLADADRAKWGWPVQSDFYNRTDHFNIDEGCNELTNDFLAQRRTYMYITRSVDNGGMIPHAQPEFSKIIFGEIEAVPASGIKDEEYFELVNTNNFAVDISGWQISNAVSFIFQGGTVIPAGWSIYLSPDVKAFRARDESPKGGEDIFLQGNYAGHLSSDPETIYLVDKSGDVVAIAATIPEPCLIIIGYLFLMIYYRRNSYR